MNESIDSAHVNWAGDDGSSQSEVISQSINASGFTIITGGITLTEGVTYSITSQLFDVAHNRTAMLLEYWCGSNKPIHFKCI